ncbi:hypothetical protein HZH68_013230 [Vespula germanica]|uniref:Uncharacterized protein n=1 Tax=Vespula germanica TaxID=30212 RepID=A0A834JCH0_VESGE|nr:hypothetical protein HZH68_013230 [Vespula germanica]
MQVKLCFENLKRHLFSNSILEKYSTVTSRSCQTIEASFPVIHECSDHFSSMLIDLSYKRREKEGKEVGMIISCLMSLKA